MLLLLNFLICRLQSPLACISSYKLTHFYHILPIVTHTHTHTGTENPAEDEDRIKVAVDKTGGSYCITQRWIHKFDVIQGAKGKKNTSEVR